MSTDTQKAQQVEQVRQAEQEWIRWHEERTATVSAPYGPLSLTGTHWLSDHPEGRIPAVPGQWREDGDELVLTATAEDGLTVDGSPSPARCGSPRTAARSKPPASPTASGGWSC